VRARRGVSAVRRLARYLAPCAVAAWLAGAPGLAAAQVARGVVVDPGDVPVPGVVVQLVDRARLVVARTLSNERGEFRLAAPREATYTIATLRIGFRPSLAGPFVLRRGEEVERRVTLTGLQASLDTVRVAATSVCGRAASDSAAVTFAAWEQVRAALTATQLSADASGVIATVVGYRRTLDALGVRVKKQETVVRTGAVRQPWSSSPVASLHTNGYVDATGDSTVYYAPGLDMLVSATFLEDHCFRLVQSRDRSQLGIGFDPTKDRRDLTDIRGTLWLDRASAQLRSLEYRYTNVSVDEEHAATGGAMQFARLSNGAWVISRWSIRMPVMERRMAVTGARGRTFTTMPENAVTGIEVAGGDLSMVRRGADTLWTHALLTLAGTLLDSASGRAVAGARLALDGTASSATTDAQGKFTFGGLLPGEYALVVHTPALDSMGAVHQARAVASDSATPTVVRVPSPAQLVSSLCGRRIGSASAGPGIVIGTATLVGDPAFPKHLKVSAEWTEIALRGGGVERPRRFLDASVDAERNYRLCGLPLATDLLVSATSDEGRAEPSPVRLTPESRLQRADLDIDPRAAPAAEFSGVVVDSAGQAVADAEVAIPSLQKSLLTSGAGAFRLREIVPGTYTVRARKIGYGPLEATLTFGSNERLVKRIVLTRVATLEEVRVTATVTAPWMREFEDNRRLGLGHFLTREDLAKKEGQSFVSIIRELPGTDVKVGKSNHSWLMSGRGPKGSKLLLDGADTALGARPGCYAQIYLDDLALFTGRESADGRLQPLADLTLLPSPDRIEAIEYYAGPAETPAKYLNLNSQCGVLVVHTRISP